ncbi:hypothetical protein [Thermogymnomonas acidicola]|uniref:hypothetical protein n=1 Tax=Thermogymnomonas acidicola TaxID=399579 RepID=UPI0013969AC2|nr:hypothetical protein [Thermogymnomonas acidicola]
MRRKVLDYIKRRAGEGGLTVVFTTHFLDEADYLCDRISIMAGGKIVAQGGKASELKVRYSGLRTLEVDAGSCTGSCRSEGGNRLQGPRPRRLRRRQRC